ncbi:MAG: PilT/PilU family type 4a pilus ATPase [Planctomycetota bacterium]|nr:MAG: PilT/PilU family type 4a pilus ATPase [Planctomycetota bacterium]
MDIQKVLRFAVENNASDVHIQAGAPPMLRIAGQIRSVESEPLTDEEIAEFITSIAPQQDGDSLEKAAAKGLDFSYVIPEVSRFRCSAYRHLGQFGIVMRLIRTEIPSIEDLHLPTVIHDIALSQRGMTLLTGTTGSGKSTTLATMIDLINSTHRTKIITIEDPIEYVHTNKKALISQLEVGSDTTSFDQALRQALRQDPDVVLVGELRDVETLRMALRAADTGHQVYSTVHSSNAPQTIERIIAMFPPEEHKLLLAQLAASVEAIISQRLIATYKGGRRPAVEILRGSAVTEKFILENKLSELHDYIETGEAGMQTFDQHLVEMYREEVISGTEALRWATNPETLAMAMRGIKSVGSGRKGA